VAGFRFDDTHKCSQRRRRGSGLEGLAAPPCGQLTRCFSAVAELLVIISIILFSFYVLDQRHSEGARTAWGGNQEGRQKWGDKGIGHLTTFGGGDNPRYAGYRKFSAILRVKNLFYNLSRRLEEDVLFRYGGVPSISTINRIIRLTSDEQQDEDVERNSTQVSDIDVKNVAVKI